MDFESLEKAWKSEGDGPDIESQHWEKIMTEDKRLHRKIIWRDRIETAVAVLMFPFFLFFGGFMFANGLIIAGLGCLWLCACLVYIPLKLRRARQLTKQSNMDLGMDDYLHKERAAMVAQYELISGVFWWYLLPLGAGVLMVFAGIRGLSLPTLWYTLGVVGLYGLIYLGNKRAADNQFLPRIQQIDRSLEELKAEAV